MDAPGPAATRGAPCLTLHPLVRELIAYTTPDHDKTAYHDGVRTVELQYLGADHPDTLTSHDDLAYDYQAAGRLTDANRPGLCR